MGQWRVYRMGDGCVNWRNVLLMDREMMWWRCCMCRQLSSMCVCVSVMCEPCWEQIGHVLGTGRSSSTSPLL